MEDAIEILTDLVNNASFFNSAIELEMCFDGDQLKERIEKVLSEYTMKTEIINLRVEKELKEKTTKKAKSQDRTLSNYITHLIETDLKTTK